MLVVADGTTKERLVPTAVLPTKKILTVQYSHFLMKSGIKEKLHQL